MQQPNKGIWIYKPSSENQGKGINVVYDIEAFKAQFKSQKLSLKEENPRKNPHQTPQRSNNVKLPRLKSKENVTVKADQFRAQSQNIIVKRDSEKQIIKVYKRGIIQKYIENPLLLNKKKFDIRCFVLLAKASPYLVLFQDGYLRVNIDDYQTDNFTDRTTHLTNAAIQKRHPNFKNVKEDTIWTMTALKDYLINDGHSAESVDKMHLQIKRVCAFVHLAAQNRLCQENNMFEMFGCDFMLDTQLIPYLLEVNTNPALFTETKVQGKVIPQVVRQTLDIILDLYSQPDKMVTRLQQKQINFQNFEVLINEASQECLI